MIGLAGAAPCLWALGDLAVTGDLLFSVTGAREVERAIDPGTRPPGDLVAGELDQLRILVRWPVLVIAPGGLLIAAALRHSRAGVAAALLALGLATYASLDVLGLPVTDRFLFLPGVALALFGAYFAVGWTGRPPGPLRRAWMLPGVGVVAGLLVSAPPQASRLDDLAGVLAGKREVGADLRGLATSPAGEPLRSCSPVWAQSIQPLPALAYHARRSFAAISPPEAQPRGRGVLVAPATPRVAELAYDTGPRGAAPFTAPAGFRRTGGNASWTLYTRGC